MTEQFFTTCKYCGRQILMTRNHANGLWVACDPTLYRFRPSDGPMLYVTPDGVTMRGEHDRDGQFGYMKHRRKCAG